jgi:hypothetical protein
MFTLTRNQAQMITFVMIDSNGLEAAGLGGAFTLALAKGSGAFAPSAGTKGEISSGWYYYLTAAAETDTPGPLSVKVTGAGAVQQNLAYLVETTLVNAIDFTYTVTNANNGLPLQGVMVWITTDVGGVNVIWTGVTDVFGVARDNYNRIPRLQAGTYQFFRLKPGFTFTDPDEEIVS